jgi:hypothetical protein
LNADIAFYSRFPDVWNSELSRPSFCERRTGQIGRARSEITRLVDVTKSESRENKQNARPFPQRFIFFNNENRHKRRSTDFISPNQGGTWQAANKKDSQQWITEKTSEGRINEDL